MIFRYRYVRFGTTFTSELGTRQEGTSEPSLLFQNELAVDVGAACWGFAGERRSILDHHFFRETGEQFPSAAAAVLHQARLIWDKFGSTGDQEVVWLVTHWLTDFDAFCAMYLARRILERGDSRERIPNDGWEEFGLAPNGWLGEQKLDWFMPDLRRFANEPDRRWAVLLAAYAACVDNCRRVSCPKHRALHSILYAALARGRNYLSEESGAIEFFRKAEQNIVEAELNPLFDSVLENSITFAPELAMLDREIEAYRRDLKRSRRALVYVPKASDEFGKWFPPVRDVPLLRDGKPGEIRLQPAEIQLQPAEIQLQPSNGRREQADGCYLRDPECLLFKEWVRDDIENASVGQGFLFTAIAYSHRRANAAMNTTEYFFSLDPEKADKRHLYNVWVRLQSAEINALLRTPELAATRRELDRAEAMAALGEARTRARPGFERRAGALSAYFDDPWFDGNNYACTIVATPNRGTFIGEPGTKDDLSDDPVVSLVQQEMELALYGSDVSVSHFPASLGRHSRASEAHALTSIDTIAPEPRGDLRFASIELKEDVNVLHGAMAEQIGRMLWRILHGPGGAVVPADFCERHLLVNVEWVGVWSRGGAAIAHKRAALQTAREFHDQFKEFAEFRRAVQSLVEPRSGNTPKHEDVIGRIEPLMRKAAQFRHNLALPENQLPNRFFDATRLGENLETVRDVATARNISIVARVQTMVEYIEVFLVSVYAAHLTDMLATQLPDARKHLLVSLAASVGAIATAGLVLQDRRERLIVTLAAMLFVLSFALAAVFPVTPGSLAPESLGWPIGAMVVDAVAAYLFVLRKHMGSEGAPRRARGSTSEDDRRRDPRR